MIGLKLLQQTVKEGLELVSQEEGLIEAVVYASANRRTVGRLVYTSHIACNGLEEPKSDDDFGVSVDIWFEKDGQKLIGFGQEPNDISIEAVKAALEKAKRDAVPDPEFYGFLKKESLATLEYGLGANYHDASLIDLSPQEEAEMLAKISWETIDGAVEAIAEYSHQIDLDPEQLAFILNGDNFIIRERMAMASTNGIVDTDESTVVLSLLTAMVESGNGKGSAWGARPHLKELHAKEIGREVAEAAINNIGGVRVESGNHRVIFGPQAVAELFGSLLSPHFNLGMVDFGVSIYQGKYGKEITSPLLSIYDDPIMPGGAGSKRVTDEGAPTRRTDLVKDGKLVGYLSDYSMFSRMLAKQQESEEKLGANPESVLDAIAPHNGFKYALGGGRVAASGVSVNGTNLVISSNSPQTTDELLQNVKDGIYIGRLWYTYPIGGYASGIISGTAIADCYVIRDGKLAEPILPNTLRIEDNIGEMMKNIIGISDSPRPTILWSSDEITHAPWVAIDGVHFDQINISK